MPELNDADVKPKPVGEEPEEVDANPDTASVSISKPNEKGLDREANDATGEPAIEPADEVSEGR